MHVQFDHILLLFKFSQIFFSLFTLIYFLLNIQAKNPIQQLNQENKTKPIQAKLTPHKTIIK